MEFQKVLETRRSVRNYDSSKAVDQQTVRELLEAVILAPSWKNSQTSRYYCVFSEDVRKIIIHDCLPAFNGNSVKNAPVLIISTFVKNCSGFERSGEPTNEIGNGWGFYDLGLHDQNLLLKATDLGLDTLVIGIRDQDKIRELLDISDEEIIVSVIAGGYGTEKTTMPKRKLVDEIARFY